MPKAELPKHLCRKCRWSSSWPRLNGTILCCIYPRVPKCFADSFILVVDPVDDRPCDCYEEKETVE
jgi:hypothetical protein